MGHFPWRMFCPYVFCLRGFYSARRRGHCFTIEQIVCADNIRLMETLIYKLVEAIFFKPHRVGTDKVGAENAPKTHAMENGPK